jgi:hypothetical protein
LRTQKSASAIFLKFPLLSRDMDFIFRPNSVAVVGASRTEGKLGYTVLKNIKEGFKGKNISCKS